MNVNHKEILQQIELNSGKSTQHTFLDNYLGNNHPRFAISVPVLRKIAKDWMSAHRDLPVSKFAAMLTSLIKGKSSTEKTIAGILLDYSTLQQRKFAPKLFNGWLDYLEGWAEVDSLCAGRYSETEVLSQWKTWRSQLIQLSKSGNIHKRRASLVLLCSPLRKSEDPRLTEIALHNVRLLKNEKEILITKAISWVLRTMIKFHRHQVEGFMKDENGLPSIAIRETKQVLNTGRKTSKK